MLIQVTEEDIKLGVQRHSHRCPIALAFQRIGVRATVTYEGVEVRSQGEKPKCFWTNAELSAWQIKYDEHGPSSVQPITIKASGAFISVIDEPR